MSVHSISMDTNLRVIEAGMNELGLKLKDTLYQSNFIRNHFDFYQWQQQYVSRFIPHNILIAGWGNFEKGHLQFDISSSITEVHAQQRSSGCNEIKPLMTALFHKWEENEDNWFFNEEFTIAELMLDFSPADKIVNELTAMSTVLVYGFRDQRSENDVLYAFFNLSSYELETQTSVLNIIMPHLDGALRRIECLPKNNASVLSIPTIKSVISERESAVMNLVVQGNTNIEIAKSLFISVNTVKNHLKNIFKKMNVSSRAEAVAKYFKTSNQIETYSTGIHKISER